MEWSTPIAPKDLVTHTDRPSAPASSTTGEVTPSPVDPTDFRNRHIGPDEPETAVLLARSAWRTLEELADAAVPAEHPTGRCRPRAVAARARHRDRDARPSCARSPTATRSWCR